MQANNVKGGAHTVTTGPGSVLMLGEICIGITGERLALAITECGGGKGSSLNQPIVTGSIEFIGGSPGRLR